MDTNHEEHYLAGELLAELPTSFEPNSPSLIKLCGTILTWTGNHTSSEYLA